MLVYNLFPLLAGPFPRWRSHCERAATMGFDWLFINPIQRPGSSGSLYSIRDHFQLNPLLIEGAGGEGELQARAAISAAHTAGLRVMVDLVINHCAFDSPIVGQHPEWFLHDDAGEIEHPSCIEDGQKVVWGDLVRFDYEGTSDPEGLFEFVARTTEFLLSLGVDGFRCDAAYQVPPALWSRLFERVRRARPNIVFVAETLGCTPEETLATARAGFDFIFNSSKWWDFEAGWLPRQYELTRRVAPSIGFPESHDTQRLFSEASGNVAALKQRYLFTALFSTGVMMPMGFEFGFANKPDVVTTRPEDWEAPNFDLSGFVSAVNAVKRTEAAFSQDGPMRVLPLGGADVLVLWKATQAGDGQGVIVLNKSVAERKPFNVIALDELLPHRRFPVRCVSPENALGFLPEPLRYDLRPGEAIVLASDRIATL